MVRMPAPASHPQFEKLFIYSVSRNQSLAQLANQALETQISKNRVFMASLMARMPVWLQVAFVDNVRHNKTAISRLFVRDLRKITPHDDVVYEIDSLRN